MGKLSQWLKITCEDTSPLVSEAMDHDLPLSKRLRVWIHLVICEMCKNCETQMKTLRALAYSLGEEDSKLNSYRGLSLEAKEKMKQAMKASN